MGGDSKDSKNRAEEERRRGEQAKAEAVQMSALTPEEVASRTRGFGAEEQLVGMARHPQTFIDQALPAVKGLVQNLIQQQFTDVLDPKFQDRGLTQSGLKVEGGTRAAVQQAIGVANLVLNRATANANLLRGVTGDVLGRGLQAQGRATQGGLTGLGLQSQAQGRAAGIEEAGAVRESERQGALGGLAARGIGGIAALATGQPQLLPGLIAGISTPGLGGASQLLQQQNLAGLDKYGMSNLNPGFAPGPRDRFTPRPVGP